MRNKKSIFTFTCVGRIFLLHQYSKTQPHRKHIYKEKKTVLLTKSPHKKNFERDELQTNLCACSYARILYFRFEMKIPLLVTQKWNTLFLLSPLHNPTLASFLPYRKLKLKFQIFIFGKGTPYYRRRTQKVSYIVKLNISPLKKYRNFRGILTIERCF